MSLKEINLKISIGKVTPQTAPAYIVEALESVEVTRTGESPSTFRVNFRANRGRGLEQDYKLLSSPLLQAFNRVVLSVSFEGKSYPLMDGFITSQALQYTGKPGEAALVVSGEDVSLAMDIEEVSREFPRKGDAVLAGMVLDKYKSLGIKAEISQPPSKNSPISQERYAQQNTTDRRYLRQLAAYHGFIFYVKPGSGNLTNIAYWGPPNRGGTPQMALTVDMGPATNVESIDFQYNALDPVLVKGELQDDITEEDMGLQIFNSTRTTPLAANPAIKANRSFLRKKQYCDPRLGFNRGRNLAQSQTNRSTDKAVVASGQLDTLRCGNVLDAPGLVNVRGVGRTYDGTYYIRQVIHRISPEKYNQFFTLTREGTGSSISKV
jgi:hypothetical protein